MAQMQDFINTASLYDTSTHSGAASAKVYEEEARMQM
jgi:hypothetical protein